MVKLYSSQNVQLIIPMSGYGSRFAAAGYTTLKQLIIVHGLTMIEWVVKAFVSRHQTLNGPIKRIVFICREKHLAQYPNMRNILLNSIEKAGHNHASNIKIEIVALSDPVSTKKGPVAALYLAKEFIRDDMPTVVSYCDYYMQWNSHIFWDRVFDTRCDGALPCYTGFHPHLLRHKNVYASCKVDSTDNLIEIREKYSFANNKQEALHSPGAYYFGSGRILKHYVDEMLSRDDMITGGEYFVSLLYNLMVRDSMSVKVWSVVEKFCQWGTPEDLDEYLFFVESIFESTDTYSKVCRQIIEN